LNFRGGIRRSNSFSQIYITMIVLNIIKGGKKCTISIDQEKAAHERLPETADNYEKMLFEDTFMDKPPTVRNELWSLQKKEISSLW